MWLCFSREWSSFVNLCWNICSWRKYDVWDLLQNNLRREWMRQDWVNSWDGQMDKTGLVCCGARLGAGSCDKWSSWCEQGPPTEARGWLETVSRPAPYFRLLSQDLFARDSGDHDGPAPSYWGGALCPLRLGTATNWHVGCDAQNPSRLLSEASLSHGEEILPWRCGLLQRNPAFRSHLCLFPVQPLLLAPWCIVEQTIASCRS